MCRETNETKYKSADKPRRCWQFYLACMYSDRFQLVALHFYGEFFVFVPSTQHTAAHNRNESKNNTPNTRTGKCMQ